MVNRNSVFFFFFFYWLIKPLRVFHIIWFLQASSPMLKKKKKQKMKTTTKKLESEYPCSPSLVYFFISAVVKKKKFFPLVVQLYHTEGAGQYSNNSSNSRLPVKGKITLSLFQQEETTMRIDRCMGKFQNESLGWGRGGGRADIEPKPALEF